MIEVSKQLKLEGTTWNSAFTMQLSKQLNPEKYPPSGLPQIIYLSAPEPIANPLRSPCHRKTGSEQILKNNARPERKVAKREMGGNSGRAQVKIKKID